MPGVTNSRFRVYDVPGREEATLVNKVKQAGRYTVRFNGSGVASGTSFYRLVAGCCNEAKKFMRLKVVWS